MFLWNQISYYNNLIYSIHVNIFQQFAQVIEPVKLSTAYDIIFIFWIYLYNVKLFNESLKYYYSFLRGFSVLSIIGTPMVYCASVCA